MKNFLLVLITVLVLHACKNDKPTESQNDKIHHVENNLTSAVHIEGTPTWSIQERMEHYGVPGVSIAIINDYKIDWVKSYGIMDKGSQSPVTKLTLFQAGSISKPVAAYGALKLVQENKMNLDQNVNDFLQSWKLPDNEFTLDKKIALKHLLSHTAGTTVHGFLGYSPDLQVPSLIQVLNGLPPANSSAIFVNKIPEDSFRYSGGGYTIMQQMMIDVEGKSFPMLMNNLILEPLDMLNSTYNQPLEKDQLKMAATGYLPDGSMTKGKRHTYPEMAAAGLWTTAGDLAKFTVDIQRSIKGESEIILSQELAEKMLTPFVEDFIGLGIFIDKRGNETYFGHGGWDEGFSSEVVAHKNKGYGVVVLTNSNHPAFISELIRSVALTYQWDHYVPVHSKIEMNHDELDQISGRYKVNNDDLIEIIHRDNRLFRKNFGDNSIELFKISESNYIGREWNRPIQFKANQKNQRFDMLVLNPDDGTVHATYSRMDDNTKLPIEILETGNFEKALNAYQELMKNNADDPVIRENRINRLGYNLLGKDRLQLAIDVFRINMFLYPNSANVYDSYAESLMENGDLDQSIIHYKKSLELEPNNPNAVKMIEKMEKEMAEKQ